MLSIFFRLFHDRMCRTRDETDLVGHQVLGFDPTVLVRSGQQGEIEISIREELLEHTRTTIDDLHMDVWILHMKGIQHRRQHIGSPKCIDAENDTAALQIRRILHLVLDVLILRGRRIRVLKQQLPRLRRTHTTRRAHEDPVPKRPLIIREKLRQTRLRHVQTLRRPRNTLLLINRNQKIQILQFHLSSSSRTYSNNYY